MYKKIIITVTSILFTFGAMGSAFAAGKSATDGGNLPQGKPFQQIQQQFADIEQQIFDLVGDIEDLELRVSANENAIVSLQLANIELEQKAAELIAAVGDNQDDIDALQEQYENNLSLIAGLQDQIDAINENLTLKQDLIDGTCPEGSALSSINPDGSVSCVSIGGGATNTQVTQLGYVGGNYYTYSYYNHQHPYDCGIFDLDTCYYDHTHYYSIFNYAYSSAYATCPEDSFLVGGGYSDTDNLVVTGNHSTTNANYKGQSWVVSVRNTSSVGRYFKATADCVKIE